MRARPRSHYSINMRELDRAKIALERVLEHIFIVDMSYKGKIEYQSKMNIPHDELTLNVKAATEYIAEQSGILQKLIDTMKETITNG